MKWSEKSQKPLWNMLFYRHSLIKQKPSSFETGAKNFGLVVIFVLYNLDVGVKIYLSYLFVSFHLIKMIAKHFDKVTIDYYQLCFSMALSEGNVKNKLLPRIKPRLNVFTATFWIWKYVKLAYCWTKFLPSKILSSHHLLVNSEHYLHNL